MRANACNLRAVKRDKSIRLKGHTAAQAAKVADAASEVGIRLSLNAVVNMAVNAGLPLLRKKLTRK